MEWEVDMVIVECICNVGHSQGKACPAHGAHLAVLEYLRANPSVDVGLNTLALRCGVDLYIGDLGAVEEPYGDVNASPYAQACRRGVCTLGLTPDCAYSVVHELSHILVGFDGGRVGGVEARVLEWHLLLASMLGEPFRSPAMPEEPARDNGVMSKDDNPHDVTDDEIDTALRTARNLATALQRTDLVDGIDALLKRPGELSEKEQKQWNAETSRKFKAMELARHQAKTDAQVLHNTHIREGLEKAVGEWLSSIFKQSHPSAIPSFEDGTEVTLKLKAGQVATGDHGENLYQVLVENRTKEVI